MLAGLNAGDKVVVYPGDKVADGVRVRQMRQMITGVRTKGEPVKDVPEKGKGKTKDKDGEAKTEPAKDDTASS